MPGSGPRLRACRRARTVECGSAHRRANERTMRPPTSAAFSIACGCSGTTTFHAVTLDVLEIDRDDAAVRRVLVGAQIHPRLIVADRREFGVERFDDRLDRRGDVRPAGVAEMDEVQLVVVVGAAKRADENVAAVFADRRVDDPGRMIQALVDQDVVGLRRADAVVIDRLVRRAPLRGPCPPAVRDTANRRIRSNRASTTDPRSAPRRSRRSGPRRSRRCGRAASPSPRRLRRSRRRQAAHPVTARTARARSIRPARAGSDR